MFYDALYIMTLGYRKYEFDFNIKHRFFSRVCKFINMLNLCFSRHHLIKVPPRLLPRSPAVRETFPSYLTVTYCVERNMENGH